MSNLALVASSNVTIRVINKYGKITRTSYIHNKANMQLVEGILQFLQGNFTQSGLGKGWTPGDASAYIPSEVRFGNIGVKMSDDRVSSDKPRLVRIADEEIKKPTFDEVKLQEELWVANPQIRVDQWAAKKIKFESSTITIFDDPNNSLGLQLRAYIPAGHLVGFYDEDSQGNQTLVPFIDKNVMWEQSGNGWVYWDPSINEYETLLTEMGLYSSTGQLLARVILDGKIEIKEDGEIIYEKDDYMNNPIIQSESSSLLVEWTIGIVSIGQNDEIISGADLKDFLKS